MPVQAAMDRYARTMTQVGHLLRARPQTTAGGAPTAWQNTLRGPIVLMTAAAFEGFAENLVSEIMTANNANASTIASAVGRLTNPDAAAAATAVRKALNLPHNTPHVPGAQFACEVDVPAARTSTTSTSGWWLRQTLDWATVLPYTQSWIQVRHALTHGAVTTQGPQTWPPPHNPGARDASQVLRLAYSVQKQPKGHSLDYRNCLNCVRAFDAVAIELASFAATHRNEPAIAVPSLPSASWPVSAQGKVSTTLAWS